MSLYTLHNKDEGVARRLARKRAVERAGAREAVCRCVADFVKSLDAWKDPAKRKSLRINGPLNCRENKAAGGGTRGRRRSRGKAVASG